MIGFHCIENLLVRAWAAEASGLRTERGPSATASVGTAGFSAADEAGQGALGQTEAGEEGEGVQAMREPAPACSASPILALCSSPSSAHLSCSSKREEAAMEWKYGFRASE